MSQTPRLSFVCPKLWTNMSGDEQQRFCEQCGHHVHNLSTLTEPEREALLERAKTERVCVAYYRRMSGELVTPEAPLTEAERRRVVQVGAAALTLGAMALAGCATSKQSEPIEGTITTTQDQCLTESGKEVHMLLGVIVCPEDSKPKFHRKR